MYNDYFGLREAPFSIAPNPQYLFMSPRHREALAHLLYGIQSDGGFILLTGEVGTGKTTVCRCLLEQIPEDVDTAYILNPKQTAQELLATACDEFKIEYPEGASIKVLVDHLNGFLLEAHQQGRKTVLIIDEAQNLSVDVLEQLRLLTNLETNQRKLLQIILLGQPELLTLLAKQELRQLSQRVTARFHLDALSKDEVTDYIQHRLDTAGAKGSLFPPASVKKIFQISNGIPRLINLICDRALLGTYVQNRLQVDVATVKNASKEILGNQPSQNQSRLFAIAAAVLFVSVMGFMSYSNSPSGTDATPALTTTDSKPAAAEVASLDTATVDEPSREAGEPELTAPITELPTNSEALPEADTLSTNQAESGSVEDSQISQASALTPTPTATVVALPFLPLESTVGFTTQLEAFSDLLKIWDINTVLAPQSDPCEVAAVSGLSCLAKLGSLRDIAHMNRPVIVNLNNKNGSPWFVITSVTNEYVQITRRGTNYRVSSEEVLTAWSGWFTLLWRSPPVYDQPAKLGDKGPAVDWLQTQLAFVEGSEVPSIIAGTTYDSDLESRVKRFQISVGLVPDGIVGPQTWIHLNSADDSDIPKLD